MVLALRQKGVQVLSYSIIKEAKSIAEKLGRFVILTNSIWLRLEYQVYVWY